MSGRHDRVEEIAPGVHAIRLRFVWVHVLEGSDAGDGLTLIDCGLPGSARTIERALAAIGGDLDDVGRVVCTHAHPDHAGGARELAALGLPILMHPADIATLTADARTAVSQPSRASLLAYATPTPVPDRLVPIEDGEVLPALGALRAVHTPGHTPGSICLYAPRDRILFVGDALQVTRDRLDFANTVASTDIAQARRSVGLMATLDVAAIVFSHYRPWHTDASASLRALASQHPRLGA